MCGRFANHLEDMGDWLDVLDDWPQDAVRGFNIAPSQTIPAFTPDGGQGMRWGLIPGWSQQPDSRFATFNARLESAHSKPSFRDAWQRSQRCLIPTLGYFEWRQESGRKQPYFIRAADQQPLVLAGLYEPAHDGQPASCSILTTEARSDLVDIHPRMPVFVPQHAVDDLFGVAPDELLALIDDWKQIEIERRRVGTQVNRVDAEGEQLIADEDQQELPF